MARKTAASAAEPTSKRVMQGPPWSCSLSGRRILTEVRETVKPARDAGQRWRIGLGALGLACLLGGAEMVEARAVPTRGELRLLVVLAGFPDRSLAEPRRHFAGGPDALVDRLVAYYGDVSVGRLRIVPTIGGPVVTLPMPRARYVQHPDALAEDALLAFAHAAVDPADRAALREANGLVVFFAGTGRESHTMRGEPDDPWSNYTPLPSLRPVPEAAVFEDACVIAEDEVPPLTSFGVLCHEFGHLLGLPELYAPGDHPQEGVGVWDLMGQGTWLGHGEHPPHLSAWSKLQLGWVEVETIERTTVGVTLPAIETVPRVLRVPAVPGHPEEYYLLENRERLGADASLPGEGLLVWHVDERVTGFRTAETDVVARTTCVAAPGAGGPGLRGRAPRRGSGAPRGEGSSAPGAGTPGRRWGLRRRRAGAGPRAGLRDRYAGHGALRRERDQGDDPQHLSARVQHAVRRAGRAV
ncbi:MAG: M6 family metalloprotease domain-containing protein [Deltaproteobacteria bacterium]|nr:MAG: M6 family metalloprotease domain-containing protein [Deltaproteobacteria bacterium]